MKILQIAPGHSFSTWDIHVGYGDALTRLGHEVYPFRLDEAVDDMTVFHYWMWRRRGRDEADRPAMSRIVYEAGVRAIEAALRLRVDWVLVVSGMLLHPDVLVMMRRAGLRVALLLTEAPYDTEQEAFVAPYAEVCFTNERASLARLRQANPNTHYLPHAAARWHFEPPEQIDVPAHDVVFVGTGFQERIDLLSAVNWDGIDLGLYGTYALLGSRSKLRRHLAGGIVGNQKTAALYRAARIGLNLYRTSMGFGRDVPRVEHAESLNPRAYELAASGCFQLSDSRAEVNDVFGQAVPTFRQAADLEWMIRYFLPRERERRELADLARRAVEGQTYEARAAIVVRELERQSQPRALRQVSA